jgi:hypothetical protein
MIENYFKSFRVGISMSSLESLRTKPSSSNYEGQGQLQLDMIGLPVGVYFLRVLGGSGFG